jgi:hypothetical protein
MVANPSSQDPHKQILPKWAGAGWRVIYMRPVQLGGEKVACYYMYGLALPSACSSLRSSHFLLHYNKLKIEDLIKMYQKGFDAKRPIRSILKLL